MTDRRNDNQRIAEIEARLAEATAGPWESLGHEILGPDGADGCNGRRIVCSDLDWQNRQFIAHAPTDIAYLLEEVRRLQKLMPRTALVLRDGRRFDRGKMVFIDPKPDGTWETEEERKQLMSDLDWEEAHWA